MQDEPSIYQKHVESLREARRQETAERRKKTSLRGLTPSFVWRKGTTVAELYMYNEYEQLQLIATIHAVNPNDSDWLVERISRFYNEGVAREHARD